MAKLEKPNELAKLKNLISPCVLGGPRCISNPATRPCGRAGNPFCLAGLLSGEGVTLHALDGGHEALARETLSNDLDLHPADRQLLEELLSLFLDWPFKGLGPVPNQLFRLALRNLFPGIFTEEAHHDAH